MSIDCTEPRTEPRLADDDDALDPVFDLHGDRDQVLPPTTMAEVHARLEFLFETVGEIFEAVWGHPSGGAHGRGRLMGRASLTAAALTDAAAMPAGATIHADNETGRFAWSTRRRRRHGVLVRSVRAPRPTATVGRPLLARSLLPLTVPVTTSSFDCTCN